MYNHAAVQRQKKRFVSIGNNNSWSNPTMKFTAGAPIAELIVCCRYNAEWGYNSLHI